MFRINVDDLVSQNQIPEAWFLFTNSKCSQTHWLKTHGTPGKYFFFTPEKPFNFIVNRSKICILIKIHIYPLLPLPNSNRREKKHLLIFYQDKTFISERQTKASNITPHLCIPFPPILERFLHKSYGHFLGKMINISLYNYTYFSLLKDKYFWQLAMETLHKMTAVNPPRMRINSSLNVCG